MIRPVVTLKIFQEGGSFLNDTVTGGLHTGFSLLLACIIISLVVFLMNSGKTLASSVSSKTSAINANIEEDAYMQYDGTTVKGADVVNCIKRNKDSIEIVINKYCGRDKDSAVLTTWSTKSLNGATFNNLPSYAYDDMTGNPLADHQLYVNPNAEFLGAITKNANGVITMITFTQTKYRQDAYEVPDSGNTTIVINNTGNDTSAALTTAIAGLTTASASLNTAIENLQSTGNGANTVQAQTLAILQTLSTEVLPNMSQKIDDLSGVTGSDSTISEDIKAMKGKVNSLYTMLENADLTNTKHNTDNVYDNVQTANGMLTGLSANVKTISEDLVELKSTASKISGQISSLSSQMSSDHAAIMSALSSIQQTQASQNAQLSAIAAGVDAKNRQISDLQDTIQQKNDTISSLYDTIADLNKALASRPNNVTTYGDLQKYSETDASYLKQMQDFEKNYQELVCSLNVVSNSYDSLDKWFEKHPGGKV